MKAHYTPYTWNLTVIEPKAQQKLQWSFLKFSDLCCGNRKGARVKADIFHILQNNL